MVSFIGGLTLQVKNKNGITVAISWVSFVGPEQSGPGSSTHSINAAAGHPPEGLVILRERYGKIKKQETQNKWN